MGVNEGDLQLSIDDVLDRRDPGKLFNNCYCYTNI